MLETFDRVLKNGVVVNHEGVALRDIGIRGERIAAIGQFQHPQADEVIDCTGLTILPGVIDSQVHFREPGLDYKEDLETGANAAVLGGVTSVFEMPNTNPQTTTLESFHDKIKRATGRMSCDFAFYAGGTAENIALIPEFEKLVGCAGIKVFMGSSTGPLLVADDKSLAEILKRTRRRATFHAEDEPRLIERKNLRIPNDPSSHPFWRDEETAFKATTRLVQLAHQHAARIHVLHISSAKEMQFLAQHKDVASV